MVNDDLRELRLKLSDSHTFSGLATFLNPYSYLLIRKHIRTLISMDRIYVDGQLLVLYFKILGISTVNRCSFDMTSLAPVVFSEAEKSGQTIYFLGSKAEEVTSAVDEICSQFPNLNVVGYRDGYIKEDERAIEVEKIVKLNPSIVVVGMGALLQEKFLIELRREGWSGTGFTCGGFLHQTASGLDYYPSWVNKLHLRWAYRIYDEPKLARRYFFYYPKALALIFWDFKVKPKL